jgi:hypothetical protein
VKTSAATVVSTLATYCTPLAKQSPLGCAARRSAKRRRKRDMRPRDNYIPGDRCKKGYLYQVSCRNFNYAVYDGNGGFIGIREKFGRRYLFTEHHFDQGPQLGTVFPFEEIKQIPDSIQASEYTIAEGVEGRPENYLLFKYLDAMEWAGRRGGEHVGS